MNTLSAQASLLLEDVRAGGKASLAKALAMLERDGTSEASLSLLDAAFLAPKAHVLGVTGPPGVGKSTLMAALIKALRANGRTVGIVAVDPSSKRSRGALLGDRTRIDIDPEDTGVFFRSMAARERLGGLAALTTNAVVLMRAVFDVVIVETVGVGQSETDIDQVCDTVVFCIQPGSGDSLQFMKAGIVEIPDIALVTKADLGDIAERTRLDLKSALRIAGARREGWTIPIIKVAAGTGDGLDEVIAAADRHLAFLKADDRLAAKRSHQAQSWLIDALREAFGRHGLARAADLPGGLKLDAGEPPFRRQAALAEALSR